MFLNVLDEKVNKNGHGTCTKILCHHYSKKRGTRKITVSSALKVINLFCISSVNTLTVETQANVICN